MKITAVRCFEVSGPADHPKLEERQVGMLDTYPEFAARPFVRNTSSRSSAIYVQVETDDGPSGM
ncbi:MAG TPA: hypothetical protein VKT80_00600, partial [Chloroflexota bacterium]|nr:hypothetical protein [Chloroflexota bacterium]